MSLWESTDFNNEPRKCEYCGQEVHKWIEIVPGGDLCINCAHNSMRILFQDIIQYHNGVSVSLLDIMFHGNKDVYGMRLPSGTRPSGKEYYKTDNIKNKAKKTGNKHPVLELFDF